MNLDKGANETVCQYLWRVDGLIRSGVFKNWREVTPIVNSQIFDDEKDYLGESAFRKKVAAARQFYEDGVFGSFTDEDYINKLKEQQRDLEMAKVRYRDERNSWSKQNRSQARIEETLDRLEELIKQTTPYKCGDIGDTVADLDNDLVVCLSDYHMGRESKKTFIGGEFNPDVAQQRLGKYARNIQEIAFRHQSENVYILLLGDQIDGKIHYAQSLENRMNVIEQLQEAAEDISWFISELSGMFTKAYVVNVAGNHSRIGAKEDTLRDERLDDLITWYAKAKLSNVKNVEFCDFKLDPTIAAIPIRGKNYLAVHGDYDSFDSSGIQKLSMFCHMIPQGIFMGHKHTSDYSECSGVSLVRSGSFANGGDYVTKNRFVSKPSQAVCVLNKNGISAFYPVDLCAE